MFSASELSIHLMCKFKALIQVFGQLDFSNYILTSKQN